MKKQAFNPYLPSYEYIPDGEPHVFGDRVYVYGSHDRFGAHGFCVNDYVCWSAPVSDLADWQYEGVIYRRTDDPNNRRKKSLYAPDVCQGPDGRFYLYYSPAPGLVRKSWYIDVAVSDRPTGPFSYYGQVDLHKWSRQFLPFDPAVYVEDGRVWLYYGSGMFFPMLDASKRTVLGGAVVELAADMKTVISEPKLTIPIAGQDEKYGSHAFFEASSLRKINGIYYFVYSSILGHELCYATSDRPDGPWTFGGTLVSNGDIGLPGHTCPKNAANFTGNTHGSLLQIEDRYFVFYHRQTNRHQFARQGCAEELHLRQDGTFLQAEITSCGLNGGPLAGIGSYEARIACHLTARRGNRFYGVFRGLPEPCFTQTGADRRERPDQYIANIRSGTTIGYKYFDFSGTKTIRIEASGHGTGSFLVRTEPDGPVTAQIPVPGNAPVPFCPGGTKCAMYLTYQGTGSVNLHTITFA